MSKIYSTQTDLTITLNTGKNITGATSIKIAYKDPKGTLGEWTATIDDAIKGIIKYNIIAPLSFTGTWTIWAKITDSSGLISIGESSNFVVYKESY
jgi:hypothetical protein